jgi:hypothetical protein
MADSKISALAAVTDLLDTDEFVLARAGATKKMDGVDLKAGVLGAWQAYTPALTADTTNPTLGTGSEVTGRYVQLGKLVIGEARIIFGTSGAAAGSGAYRVSLPVSPTNNGDAPAGIVNGRDNSVPVYQVAVALVDSANQWLILRGHGVLGWGAAIPWTWAASDWIKVVFAYEAA